MATTENGVYYQDDYTKIADILADMEKMAESIDELIEKAKYDDTDVKNNIKTIQDEQKVQNDNIEDIQTKDTEQDKLIQKLQSNMINESTEEATSLYVEDASDLPAKLEIRGNHYQETQEGTSNLAVLNEGSVTQDGITVDIENGNIKVNGTNTTTETLIFNVGTVVLTKGETYYIKRLGTVNGTGIYLNNSGTQVWGQVTETSFVANATGVFNIALTIGTNAINNTTQQFLVSKTSGANWEEGKAAMPSLYYPSEISTVKDNIKIIQCNSNFLKKQEETEITGQGLTGTVSNDGTITLNGTTTGATYIQLTDELKITTYTNSQNFEKHTLPNGSYKFISETSGETSANIHAYLRNATSNITFDVNIQSINSTNKKETTFEINKKQEYIAYIWIAANTTLTNFTMKFMLKRADDNSEYVQNEQKEYNLPIQQEMLDKDYFDLENNKEIHKWKKVILNGTENWQQSTVSNSVFFLNFADITTDTNKFKLLSNQYEYLGNVDYAGKMKNNKIYGFIVSGNLLKRIILRNDNFTTLDSFKASLAEKNMTLYYVTSTETELDLTEEQKEILKQLNNMELFKGVNNIYTEQDIALLQLNYTVDTKMYIDNKIANLKEQVNTTNELLSTTGTSAMLLDNLQNDLESEVM